MTKYITWSILAVKSYTYNKCDCSAVKSWKLRHIVKLLLKSNTAIATIQKIFRAQANWENAFLRDSSNVQQRCLGTKKWRDSKLKHRLVCNLQKSIWCRMIWKAMVLGCLWKWNSSKFSESFIRIVAPMHALTIGFFFLLVKCVLKCGVDHTWQRTSASLIYERFHSH